MGEYFCGEISPPAGGEFLCPWRQRNQNATGDGSDEHFVLIVAFPRTPLRGRVPVTFCNVSGAQNQECLGAIPFGPTGGLSKMKIGTGAVLLLRLPLPNQRSRSVSCRRGGCPHPPAPGDFSLSVGAAPCGRPLFEAPPPRGGTYWRIA